MQSAEQVGSTFASVYHSPNVHNKKANKGKTAVPIYVGHNNRANSEVVPMELGAAAKFAGNCHYCGKPGHKAADCYQRKRD